MPRGFLRRHDGADDERVLWALRRGALRVHGGADDRRVLGRMHRGLLLPRQLRVRQRRHRCYDVRCGPKDVHRGVLLRHGRECGDRQRPVQRGVLLPFRLAERYVGRRVHVQPGELLSRGLDVDGRCAGTCGRACVRACVRAEGGSEPLCVCAQCTLGNYCTGGSAAPAACMCSPGTYCAASAPAALTSCTAVRAALRSVVARSFCSCDIA